MNNPAFNQIIKKTDEELTLLKSQTNDLILLIEKAIGLCGKAIYEIREIVVRDDFNSQEDEIYFFKHIKPQISSKVIFYTNLFQVESYRPKSDKKTQVAYLKEVVKKFYNYQKENNEFYQYYKLGKTFADHLYYTRGNTDVRIHSDNILNHFDPKFSTGYDLTLARFIAHEQLKKYISNEVQKLNNSANFISGIEWTGKNVDAAELIYAMVSVGVINNGNIEIRELARLFEKMFNIKLDDIYKMFQYIQRRTDENKTKFLDQLKNALLRRLDEMEE